MAVRHTEAIAEDVERVLGASLPAIDLVDVRIVPGGVLRVLIDHPDGVDHERCARSGAPSRLPRALCARGLVPGIPRPLTKPAHYERFIGREADLRFHATHEGRRRIRGELLECDGLRVVVRDEDGGAFEIPLAAISRAHLVEEL
jgi:ribosome maturation factor RimP